MTKEKLFTQLAGLYRSILYLSVFNVFLFLIDAPVHFPAGFVVMEIGAYLAAFFTGYNVDIADGVIQQTGAIGVIAIIIITLLLGAVYYLLAYQTEKKSKIAAWIAGLSYVADMAFYFLISFDVAGVILHGYFLFQLFPLLLALNKNIPETAQVTTPPAPPVVEGMQPLPKTAEVVSVIKDEAPKKVD